MLSQKAIQQIAKHLDVPAGKMAKLFHAPKEYNFTFGDLQSFTAEELGERDQNNIQAGKETGMAIGKRIGRELTVKELKSSFGVDVVGKDIGEAVRAVKAQLERGDDYLREQIGLLNTQIAIRDEELKATRLTLSETRTKNEFVSALPSDRLNVISDDEYISFTRDQIAIREENGRSIVSMDGKDQLSDNGKPITLKEVIREVFTDRGWIPDYTPIPIPGRGGSNSSSGKLLGVSLKDEQDRWKAAGNNTFGPEFQRHIADLARENPSFDLTYDIHNYGM